MKILDHKDAINHRQDTINHRQDAINHRQDAINRVSTKDRLYVETAIHEPARCEGSKSCSDWRRVWCLNRTVLDRLSEAKGIFA